MNRILTRASSPRARALLALPLLLGLTLPQAAAGQAKPPSRPEYRVVRYDENWAALRGAPSPGLVDGLKYVPLSDSGSVFLSMGGQIRYRAESSKNFLLGSSADRTDSFGLTRMLLHADLHLGPHLRAFVEGKHALAHGRELPGGTRPLDEDVWELQNAFVDVACCGGRQAAVTARVGRQELLLGSQRLVSPLDWSNTRRTFEGVRVMTGARGLALDGFWTQPVVVRISEPNERDDETHFWGLVLRPRSPAASFAWELYALGLHQGDSTKLWGYTGEHDRYTLGGRVAKTLLSPATRLEVEGAVQRGELAGTPVAAWFVASDLSRTFAGLPARPTATVGADYSSGDANPTDDRIGTFHQLYALGHAYAGYMDLLGRQNLVELRTVLTASPIPVLQTRASLHRFLRAEVDDAAYNVAGGVLRAASGVGERTVGTEVDLTGSVRLNRHTRLEAGYGHFFPGSFMKRSPGGATGSDWVYVSTSLTF